MEDKKAERRNLNADLFLKAEFKAAQAGFLLRRHSNIHYSITNKNSNQENRWIMNLYPGNLRIYSDVNCPKKAPFLKLPLMWNLIDVVDALIFYSNDKNLTENPDMRKEIISNLVSKFEQKIVKRESIEKLAYSLWEQAGRPECDGQKFWLEAEKQLNKV